MKNLITSLFCFLAVLAPASLLHAQPGGDSLLNFIKENKSRSSIYIKKNDSVIAMLNETKVMPLASTVKIIVAIEFAKQSAFKVFDKNARIPLSDVEKYYIPNTDGNAYPAWMNYEKEKGLLINDSVSLMDVAKGMIMFSSNANMEYLFDVLGYTEINSNLHLLGLQNSTPIYPIVSALFLYQNPRNVSEDKIIKVISKLNNDDYAKAAMQIHMVLKNDSNYKKKFRPQDLTLQMQKEWSDRLPAATTKEYVRLCSILNNRSIFDDKTYAVLNDIMETVMENPANKTWLIHAGMKGGSTIFVLTKALYATLKNGTKIEMAYFFNDLTGEENARLQKWMNDFDLKVLTDEKFRKQLVF